MKNEPIVAERSILPSEVADFQDAEERSTQHGMDGYFG